MISEKIWRKKIYLLNLVCLNQINQLYAPMTEVQDLTDDEEATLFVV